MVKLSSKLWIVVFLLFFAGQKTMTQDIVPKEREIMPVDSIEINGKQIDSMIIANDSIDTDELSNDSISAKPARENDLDAPVHMTAKDSMVMVMDGGHFLYLYKDGKIEYKDINLDAEYIEMNADNSILYARFELDSVGDKFGFPVFKSSDQETEMEELWYNFKTRKMFTRNAITVQGEGYIKAAVAKKLPDDSFFMHDAIYTTCNDPECPHFYFHLTKAKFRPNKNTITGPVYLVLEGVPTFFALPFGLFPSSKSSYSSGILMPSYNDELARGFGLTEGGYYFAFSDYVDLETRGEIYTKGSWGVSANSRYVKRYKYGGNFTASYLVTVLGDKESKHLPESDYSKSSDIRVNWSHRQDAKANPYGTFTANVDFSTSSYNRNNFRSSTLDQMSQNTKASSVSYSYRSPTLPLSVNTSASVNQRSRDSTLSVSLPNMTISASSIYPFKRKEQIGSERWYEKIYLNYTGTVRSSINDVKENEFFNKNFIKDWKNGVKHAIPVSASFNLLKFITISTSVIYNENWYSNRVNYDYNRESGKIAPVDTVYGFNRTYDYNGSVSMNTKLYGMYKPWALLGKWTKGVQIRHVFTPSVSFSGAPDFSDPRYGMYKDIYYLDNSWQRKVERHSIYQNQLFGGPSRGKTGAINFSVDNNLEMKTPIVETDSTRKISLVDNLGLRMSYNFLADSLNWSLLSASMRLKIFGQNLSLSGNFDTYTYGENGQYINVPRWKAGKGIGRFMGTSTGYSYSLSNEKVKKWFQKADKGSSSAEENDFSSNNEDDMDGFDNEGGVPQTRTSLLKSKKQEGDFDSDGYLVFTVPWNLSFTYSVNLAYDRQNFNKEKREYPYKFSHTLGFNGNISPTKAWNMTFNASYDFDVKRVANMYCSITRQMHCWSMSASIVPIGPYQNYSFSIAVNSAMLQDVKYQQSSNYRDAVNWGR